MHVTFGQNETGGDREQEPIKELQVLLLQRDSSKTADSPQILNIARQSNTSESVKKKLAIKNGKYFAAKKDQMKQDVLEMKLGSNIVLGEKPKASGDSSENRIPLKKSPQKAKKGQITLKKPQTAVQITQGRTSPR